MSVKKIAMLNCLKANEVCTGAACFKAFQEKSRSFARYKGEDIAIAAFMRCNGCEKDPLTDKGIQEKVERLHSEGVSAVHVGVCTKNRESERCPTIQTIMEMLKKQGIQVVDGTH